MARPSKKGLDYFPLDTDFLRDIKVRKIKRECGPQSVEILLCLLANIYRGDGYYFGSDEDSMFLVSDEVGAKEGLVKQVIDKALRVGFFNQDKFEKYGILTSGGIQSRYLEATKKRKEVVIADIYSINDDIKVPETRVNDTINPQSKVKESKVNKSKVNKNTEKSVPVDFADSDFQAYLKFFTDTGGQSKARLNDSLKAWSILIPDQRTQALQAAANYVNWYKETGEATRFMKNAFVFLDEMIFMDYLNPVKAVKKGQRVFSEPEWSNPDFDESTVVLDDDTQKEFEKILARNESIRKENALER